MKKKFSVNWKASKQPRKQRKYIAKAPLHICKKFMKVHLSKDLRQKQNKRHIQLKSGDKVKITRGKFKGKTGKILKIRLKTQRVSIENIQRKKRDGSKVNVGLHPSNLQIIELSERTKNKKQTEKNSPEKQTNQKEHKTLKPKNTINKKNLKNKSEENKG